MANNILYGPWARGELTRETREHLREVGPRPHYAGYGFMGVSLVLFALAGLWR